MKYIIGLVGMLLPILSGAQSPPIRPLTIGDSVPDITITNVYNYPASTIHLSDLKGKLVILDFMSTGCISCIEALPSFDSLQILYGDKILILIVSNEPQKKIETFLKRIPVARKVGLAVVSGDTILSQLFPHVYISHEVWIKDGIVKAITNPQYVNGKNIATVLNNIPVNWPVKRDISTFDYTKPVIKLNEETIPPFSYPSGIFYAVFTKNMPSIPHRFTNTTDTGTRSKCISLINLPIIDLYRYCFGQVSLPPSNIILEVKDTSRYVYNSSLDYRDQWRIENTYCYETRIPASLSKQEVQRKIATDLDFYLGLHSKWETKLVPCLVLIKKQTGGNKPSLKTIYNSVPILQHYSRTITSPYIVYQLNQNLWGVPALDESGFGDHKILGTTILDFSNLERLNKQLDKYGLEIIMEERPHEMLVITEKYQAP